MNVIFIGAMSAGKTTLIQRLTDTKIKYDKTQAVEYVRHCSSGMYLNMKYIDTPGEYMQVRSFWCSLTTASYDADLICLVQDSTSDDCWFSGGISSKFAKPVIGIVTKIDDARSNASLAEEYLRHAGCREVFHVSAFTNNGIAELFRGMHHALENYKTENKYRYAAGYFD